MGVRAALMFFQSRQRSEVSRTNINKTARNFLKIANSLRGELQLCNDAHSPHAALHEQLMVMTSRDLAAVLNEELHLFEVALRQAIELEGTSGPTRRLPEKELVYDLAYLYRRRTGRKPNSKLLNHGDQNPFQRFVLSIHEAHLAGVERIVRKRM
jgi:hypothetical protein